MIFQVVLTLEVAIKRDLRHGGAIFFEFMRLGEGFYFALDLGVF